MADLTETAPFAGLGLPLALGETRLAALPLGPITAIAPYPGQAAAVGGELGGFPGPGQVLTTPHGHLAWAGREVAFLFGRAPDLGALAAVTDQSDGWAGLSLTGADALAVLARLVPVDLATMSPPVSLRSLLNHLPLLLVHPAPEVWQVWSYRSMAGTLVHELNGAMCAVAARRARA